MKRKLFILNKWLRLIVPAAWGLKVVNAQEPDGDEGPGSGDNDGDEDAAVLEIHGQIGEDYYGTKGVDANAFGEALKQVPAGKKVVVSIHSPGGNLWDAFAIHGLIKNRGNVTTKILGIAASSASVIFQAGAKRVMPKLSMQMAHDPMSLFVAQGNADQLRSQMGDFSKAIDRLDKHTDTLAKMYADRTGNSVEDCRAIMAAETWMDGDEALEKGFCDELTEDAPVQNTFDLSCYRRVPAAIVNTATNPAPRNGASKKGIVMNRDEMIALLRSRGITVANDATDQWLKDQVKALLQAPQAAAPSAPVAPAAAAAPAQPAQPAAPVAPQAAAAAPAQVVNLADVLNQVAQLQQANLAERRTRISNTLNELADNDQIPRNSIQDGANGQPGWLSRCMTDERLLDSLRALPSRPPGMAPMGVNAQVVEDSIESLNRFTREAQSPLDSLRRGNLSMYGEAGRRAIAENALRLAQVVNQHREKLIAAMSTAGLSPIMDGTTTYSGVSVDSSLQRQVIMSESMRAFQRKLLVLAFFAHKFEQVPLEGTDTVAVPYYPLFTTASKRFTASKGYEFSGSDQALSKSLTVGGAGPDVKVAGQDRAYQPITISSYLMRRQPWVDIQKLAVMRGEQLALDILNDIITAWILQANFGNAVWAGASGAFTTSSVLAVKTACDKSDWPDAGRNLALATEYYNNLLDDPAIKAYLNVGSTEPIREGKVGGLYGFENTVGNPRIPATTDGNLVGFACFPSAILVATANILPAPGVLKKLLYWDIITDPQTGLGFAYRYGADEWMDTDLEVIESSYGSNLGELAALKRIVSQGT